MSRMRLLLPLFLLAACKSTDEGGVKVTPVGKEAVEKDVEQLDPDDPARIARRIERNIMAWQEAMLQGETQQMTALRRTIGRSVDANFDALRDLALHGDLKIHRLPAVRCLGFANRRRADARDALLVLLDDDRPYIVADAVLALGYLRDKGTDLGPIIRLLGSGDPEIRTNAAAALKDLFLVKPTPRKLTPQYLAAIDRLVTLLHDEHHVRSRRAAVWALANLRHPEVLDHLVSALKDDDEQVQIGGLRGLQVLGDQRAIEPVLEYLRQGPTQQGSSWAREVLIAIAKQMGFSTGDVQELGTSPRLWKEWFQRQRMK